MCVRARAIELPKKAKKYYMSFVSPIYLSTRESQHNFIVRILRLYEIYR